MNFTNKLNENRNEKEVKLENLKKKRIELEKKKKALEEKYNNMCEA